MTASVQGEAYVESVGRNFGWAGWMREDEVREDLKELLVADASEFGCLFDGIFYRTPSSDVQEAANLGQKRTSIRGLTWPPSHLKTHASHLQCVNRPAHLEENRAARPKRFVLHEGLENSKEYLAPAKESVAKTGLEEAGSQ